ncbi:MAG: PLP-dependent aminotransferase family protein [Actinomycetota bacterium]|nr:PLP-dependent aminotransferase family protein [Actinomycetota bacterium]
MSKKVTFDYWNHLYSNRTEYMFSSEIRDLLALSARPDIISFSGGLPEVRALNFQRLERYVKRIIKTDSDMSLQYSGSDGFYPLKTKLTEVMKLEGIDEVEEDIAITTGGQQALDLLSKVFINPGDVVITEAPSYTGALNSFKSYEAKIEGIEIDSNGMKTSILEKKLDELSKKGIQTKFIYLVPNFSNPSGVTLSLKRRKEILELAKKYNTVILEDNPYGMLRFEGKPIPTIKELDIKGDKHNVIYLSTLSKLLAPGFRIGWVVAPHPILEKIVLGVQSTILCVSTFSQRIAYEYFSDPVWQENIDKFKSIYSTRRNTMLKTLESNFPKGCSWSRPEGGFFIWLKFPKYLNTKELLADAVRNKVAFVPGSGFYANGRGINEARLAYCTEETGRIEKGIKILAGLVKEKIKLYKSFK